MPEIKGKYNTAVVYADGIEPGTAELFAKICNDPRFAGSKIRVMPDVHLGKGCAIGTTMTIGDIVVPAFVGVDIGCGMEVVRVKERTLDYAALDALIRARIPSGTAVRGTPHPYAADCGVEALRCLSRIDVQRARLSVGTLGGGNHFIEVDRSRDGALYLVIHSGSRFAGAQVAKYYQELACKKTDTYDAKALIARYRSEGRERELAAALKSLKRKSIPRDFCHVAGKDFEDYMADMAVMQTYARINRRAIADEIIRGMGLTPEDSFTTIHNYIDTESRILRKGAVSAKRGERLIIPMNMRDGSLLCVGKGNGEWNESAPHGAGRLFARGEAKRRFKMEDFIRSMEGVYTTSVRIETLDESAFAYKPREAIEKYLAETADVREAIVPVYNFKAS